MGNRRGVRRDFVALEKRRFEAVKLFERSLNNSEIGRRLKVSNQTVSRWRKGYQEDGEVALRRAGRAGRQPCLDEADKARLIELLLQGPERLGYETPLWTCPRVTHLIEKNFEVVYHPGHVWRILRQLNWSVQQPVGRALERNESLIDEWKRKRWPEIKKSRERRPDDRLHRRKWSEPTASSAAHLGASRADTGPPVSLQLENAVGHRRRHRLELLLSDLRRSDQVRADHRVS
jgi:transposase